MVLTLVAVIMRKQGEENERFAFPIMQGPLTMSQTGEGGFGPVFRNRLMWAGLAVPFLIGTLNALHYYS